MRFSQLPASVSFSDHLQPIDVIVWAYADCFKTNFEKFDGTGMKWPVIKVPKMAAHLHVSKSVLNKSLARLRAAGFLRTEQRGATGNLMILSSRASIEDTLKGREYREQDFTQIGIDLITSEFAAVKILVLIVIDRIARGNDTAYTTEKEIAKFVEKSLRSAADYVAELKHHGLLDLRERDDRPGYFEYWVIMDAPIDSPSAADDAQAAEVAEALFKRRVAAGITRIWLKGLLGDEWIEWSKDKANYDLSGVIVLSVELAVARADDLLIKDLVTDGIEDFGSGYHVDYIFKILKDYVSGEEIDELLADIDNRK